MLIENLILFCCLKKQTNKKKMHSFFFVFNVTQLDFGFHPTRRLYGNDCLCCLSITRHTTTRASSWPSWTKPDQTTSPGEANHLEEPWKSVFRVLLECFCSICKRRKTLNNRVSQKYEDKVIVMLFFRFKQVRWTVVQILLSLRVIPDTLHGVMLRSGLCGPCNYLQDFCVLLYIENSF